MSKVLSLALKDNTNELMKALSRFDYQSFNKVSAAGGWTPGQIAEHLLLFDIRVNTVFAGKSVAVTRDAQENIGAIQERLYDRDNKIDAPPFLIPSDVAKDPATLIEKILLERRKLTQTIEDADLTLSFPDTPHRLFGILTGVEWLNLLILHCKRHLVQLENIK